MGAWGSENSLTVPTDAALGPAGSGSGLLPDGLEAGAGTRVVSPAAAGGPVGSGFWVWPPARWPGGWIWNTCGFTCCRRIFT